MKMFRIVLVLAAMTALAIPLHAQELITNGDFQAVPFDTGWDSGGVVGSGVFQPVDGPLGGGAGDVAGEILAQQLAANASVKQANLGAGSLVVGDIFNISFDAKATLPVGGVTFAEFFEETSGGGASRQEFLGGGPLAVTSDWQSFSFMTTAMNDVSGGVTLQFAAVTGADAAGTALDIDNVSMVRVPEPASVAILGLGGLAMLLFRRRD